VTDATAGVGHVARIAGNQMNMEVKDGLAGRRPAAEEAVFGVAVGDGGILLHLILVSGADFFANLFWDNADVFRWRIRVSPKVLPAALFIEQAGT
jgi:hypothetical protein